MEEETNVKIEEQPKKKKFSVWGDPVAEIQF